eukprot:gb/GECH01006022.1/.p1 GENE.gb/GECH01006022.1/~~gb/GECH01006022.1/.p1  ORF type:complete len:278 (+),score=54.87 gb/GECH01006022.1/:1-834(+)
MKNNITHCANIKCQTTETPLWRKGWQLPSGKRVRLCNACGLHYKKNHYCPYCNQVYRESDADEVENPWIGCNTCQRWVHRHCEESKGDKNYLISNQTYNCPFCRKSEKQTNSNTSPNTISLPSPNSPSRKRKLQSNINLPPKKRHRNNNDGTWNYHKSNIITQTNKVLNQKIHNSNNNNIVDKNSIALPSFKYLASNIPDSNSITSSNEYNQPTDWGLTLLSPYKHQTSSKDTIKIDRKAVLRQLQKLQKNNTSFNSPSQFDRLCAVCEFERPYFDH